MATYTIRSGDTLSAIAARYNTSVSAIANANGIRNPNLIRAGQSLRIGGAAPSASGGGSSSIPAMDLQRGTTSPAVRQLQTNLVRLGHLSQAQMNTGPGIFGPATEAAVKKFQASHGVRATGYYGPLTRAAMARALGVQAPAPQGPSAPTPAPSGGGNGAAAYNIARRYLGRTANELKLANNDPVGRVMQDWVPGNVNCANFVSGVLAAAGQISGSQSNASVYGLIGNLQRDPQWRSVPLSQARPGDVIAFKTGSQHIEMVAGWENGRLKLIGSNNILSDGNQAVSHNYYGGNPLIAVMRYVG